VDQAHQLKVLLQGQQKMIPLYENDSQFGTELSFEFSDAIAEKGKAFGDGELTLKNALMSGSLPVSKLRFNLKQCACAVKMRVAAFAALLFSLLPASTTTLHDSDAVLRLIGSCKNILKI